MRDPRSALAETLSRIDSLLGDGRTRDDVLDVEELSRESGDSPDVIQLLLDGKQAPAEDITDRIIRRIVHLRETRLRPNGTPPSYGEIAASYGASRASLSNLVNSRKKRNQAGASAQDPEERPARSGGPLASAQAGIERFFFGQPTGWLSVEPETALDNALQPVLRRLEREAAGDDPLALLGNAHGLRKLAARAPQLAEGELQLLTDWIDTILERKRAEDAQGAGGDTPHTDPH